MSKYGHKGARTEALAVQPARRVRSIAATAVIVLLTGAGVATAVISANSSKLVGQPPAVHAAGIERDTLVDASTTPLVEPLPAYPSGNKTGEWGPVEPWPLIGIHSILTSEGKILTYGSDTDGAQTGRMTFDVWTPGPSAASGHATEANNTGTDLFCNVQLNRADTGDVLLLGGDLWNGTSTINEGNADIISYGAKDNSLESLPGMGLPRWYGSATTLADGSIYIQGGLGGESHAELWTPGEGAEFLPFSTEHLDYWYPRNFVLDDGRIFGYDMLGQMYFISADMQTMEPAGELTVDEHLKGSSAVMYEPGRIIQFGGKSKAVLLIDVTGPEPIVTQGHPLADRRQWVNGTLLPDGRVLATGGAEKDSQAFPDDPIETFDSVLDAVIWDPRTRRWSDAGTSAVPRLYHSTSILLPDGRVLVSGGGAPGPVQNLNAEIYSPNYLDTANHTIPRLTIDSLSSGELSVGDPLSLWINDPSGVRRVTLLKTGAVTHSFDMEQRLIELDFSVVGGSIETTVPDNINVVTPGYYLVTVLDEYDIPSESVIVHVIPGTSLSIEVMDERPITKPAARAPATDTPATQAPATEAPVAEAPTTDSGATAAETEASPGPDNPEQDPAGPDAADPSTAEPGTGEPGVSEDGTGDPAEPSGATSDPGGSPATVPAAPAVGEPGEQPAAG